ncbi:MAG: hypothetical protein NTZ90_07390 [Proteobacteria bacterium]|nr:hypothetical protein [Pseudomonadota bacterium]
MRWSLALGAISAAAALSSCVTDWLRRSPTYDTRPLAIETIGLFNQRAPSRLSAKNWKGDWIFRRDRLAMIDQDLRETKPDLLILQEAMQRIGNTAESDKSILQAGALAAYDWRQQQVQEYADTQETEQAAVAAGFPLKFLPSGDGKRETWAMGSGGYAMLATIDYEDQPIVVLNVQLPETGPGSLIWYGFLRERLTAKLVQDHLCAKRLIIAGLLPGDDSNERFAEFMQVLQLKDSSQGFCQQAGHCFTATPVNDLFMATVGEETPTRVDKILVHRSANVYSSSRAFEDFANHNQYGLEFGLERLWPTKRFGWRSQVRLGRCSDAQLGLGTL